MHVTPEQGLLVSLNVLGGLAAAASVMALRVLRSMREQSQERFDQAVADLDLALAAQAMDDAAKDNEG